MYDINVVTQTVTVNHIQLQVREPIELAHDAMLPRVVPITQQEYFDAVSIYHAYINTLGKLVDERKGFLADCSRTLESFALRAIERCYRESPLQRQIEDFEVIGEYCFVLSTEHGSVIAITDKGGIYGLMLATAADTYRINRFIKNFPWNHGMAEVGSRAYALYEKLGCDLDDVQNGMAKVSRCNKIGWDTVPVSEQLIAQWAEETGLTMWRRKCQL